MNQDGARPLAVSAAAWLGFVFAVILLGCAGFTAFEFVVGHATAEKQPLNGQELKGVVFVIVLMVAGAILLGVGAHRLVFRRSAALLVGPLLMLLVVGCIGEIADVVGTASRTSDLIGLGILLMAATPVALASSREARRWLRRDAETMHVTSD